MNSTLAVILAGGGARRAGGINKSFMLVEGRPVLDWQLDRLRPIFGERIEIATDRPDDYAARGLTCFPDPSVPWAGGGKSALLGIASALERAGDGPVFLLASDMPWPDPEIIRALAERFHREGGRGVAGLAGGGGPEPFHAFHWGGNAESARLALMAAGPGGRTAPLRSWLRSLPGARFYAAEELGFAPERLDRCLANFNSPPVDEPSAPG